MKSNMNRRFITLAGIGAALTCGLYDSKRRSQYVQIREQLISRLFRTDTLNAVENIVSVHNKDDMVLKQVQIILRHGARTPLSPMPGIKPCVWDPEILMKDFEPAKMKYLVRTHDGGSRPDSAMESGYANKKALNGGCLVGQLTILGKEQAFNVGKYLKKIYQTENKFLKDVYDKDEVYVRSSNMDRTILTAVSVLAGLYGKDTFSEPPTIYTMVSEHESLYPNYYFCKNLQKWTKFAFTNLDGVPGYKEALLKVAEALNLNKEQTMKANLPNIHGCLVSRVAHGLPVPDHLLKLSDFIEKHGARFMAFVICGNKENKTEVMKVACGSFLDVISTRIDDARKPHLKQPKLFLYSGHDTSIISFLEAVDLFNDSWPQYAAHVILELYEDKKKEWFVRTIYNGKEMTIDGCEDGYCPVEKFQSLIGRYTVKDWELACGVKKDEKASKIELGTI